MVGLFIRRCRHALLVATCLLTTAMPAWACTCFGTFSGQPACKIRWEASAVFVGRVVRIDLPPARADGLISSGDLLRVHLAIVEAFAGVTVSEREAVVTTTRDSSSCGYGFKTGETYLVYAGGPADGLGVSSCGGTKILANAGDDLRYLRTVPVAPGREGRIIGVAWRPKSDPSRSWEPFTGARVVAEGDGLRRIAVTGPDGKYEIRVPPGHYRIRAETGQGLFVTGDVEEITVKETRACAVADFSVGFDGHVMTRVVMDAGEPVPYLELELTPLEEDAWPVALTRTDAAGQLDLARVPPGRYRLSFHTGSYPSLTSSIPPMFYPGTNDRARARVVDVGPSERVTLPSLALPFGLRFVTLKGVVRDALDAVVAGARVSLMTDTPIPEPYGTFVVTNRDGGFALAVLPGRAYCLVAEHDAAAGRKARAELRDVVVTGAAPAIVLHVRSEGGPNR